MSMADNRTFSPHTVDRHPAVDAGARAAAELDYWRLAYASRPYATNRRFDDFEPAYRAAIDEYTRTSDASLFEEVEPRLRDAYQGGPGARLEWKEAREASRDAWERIARANAGTATEPQIRSAERVDGVLQMLNDSIEGFEMAMDKLQSPIFRSACQHYAAERRLLAENLRPIVASAGRTPTSSTEVCGVLGRAWTAVRVALGGGDRAIIEGIEAAEDHAVKAYREALKAEDLTPEAAMVLTQQFRAVEASHRQFSEWIRAMIALA